MGIGTSSPEEASLRYMRRCWWVRAENSIPELRMYASKALRHLK